MTGRRKLPQHKLTSMIQVRVPTAYQDQILNAVVRLRHGNKQWSYSKFLLISTLFFIKYLETQQKKEDEERAARNDHPNDVKYIGWASGVKNKKLLNAWLESVIESEQHDIRKRGGRDKTEMAKFLSDRFAAKRAEKNGEAPIYTGDFPGGEDVRE